MEVQNLFSPRKWALNKLQQKNRSICSIIDGTTKVFDALPLFTPRFRATRRQLKREKASTEESANKVN